MLTRPRTPASPLPLLLSNSFPFGLIRHPLCIQPRSVNALRKVLQERPWVSAWGHENTLQAASGIAGCNLRPAVPRPALDLDADLRPRLGTASFEEIWLLTPEYTPGFRPQAGHEVASENITGWRVLELCLEPTDAGEGGKKTERFRRVDSNAEAQHNASECRPGKPLFRVQPTPDFHRTPRLLVDSHCPGALSRLEMPGEHPL